MQPFQLFSCSGSGIAAMTEAAVQLWQLSSSSSAAITAQQQQQLSCYSSAAPAAQQCAAIPAQTALQPCSRAALQPCSLAIAVYTLGVISLTNEQSSGLGAWTIQHRDQKICALDV